MADTPFTVLGIAGSLRAASYNRKLLAACAGLLPDGAALTTFDLADIPLYNEDLRAAGYPSPVEALRSAIAAADALLFVTPEYNYSVPGVLKNALDWASRPPGPPPMGKVAATLGGSPGAHGTVRGQSHLKQVLMGMGMTVVSKPEVYVGNIDKKLDENGNLVDEATQKFVRELLSNLVTMARKLR
jgi:chromate reductase